MDVVAAFGTAVVRIKTRNSHLSLRLKLSLISPICDFNLAVITAALPMKGRTLARSQSALSVSRGVA